MLEQQINNLNLELSEDTHIEYLIWHEKLDCRVKFDL